MTMTDDAPVDERAADPEAARCDVRQMHLAEYVPGYHRRRRQLMEAARRSWLSFGPQLPAHGSWRDYDADPVAFADGGEVTNVE